MDLKIKETFIKTIRWHIYLMNSRMILVRKLNNRKSMKNN
jgi:hypothetical protein